MYYKCECGKFETAQYVIKCCQILRLKTGFIQNITKLSNKLKGLQAITEAFPDKRDLTARTLNLIGKQII